MKTWIPGTGLSPGMQLQPNANQPKDGSNPLEEAAYSAVAFALKRG